MNSEPGKLCRKILVLVLPGFLVVASAASALGPETGQADENVPDPLELRRLVKENYDAIKSVGYSKKLTGRKTVSGSEEVFPFTFEKHDVVVKGNQYRVISQTCSRAAVNSKCQYIQQETVFLPAESKDLRVNTYVRFRLADGEVFDESLLDKKQADKKLTELRAILAERHGHPLEAVPFLNGRFLPLDKSVVEMIDEQTGIKPVELNGRSCLEVTIDGTGLKCKFVLCPELKYAILNWRIEKSKPDGQLVLLTASISNISSDFSAFELEDRYELMGPDGTRQAYREVYAGFRNFRLEVSDHELERERPLPEDMEVSIVGMSQIQARWRNGEVVLVHDEQIVDALSQARMVPGGVDGGNGGERWNKLPGLYLLAIGMLVVIAFFRFRTPKERDPEVRGR